MSISCSLQTPRRLFAARVLASLEYAWFDLRDSRWFMSCRSSRLSRFFSQLVGKIFYSFSVFVASGNFIFSVIDLCLVVESDICLDLRISFINFWDALKYFLKTYFCFRFNEIHQIFLLNFCLYIVLDSLTSDQAFSVSKKNN